MEDPATKRQLPRNYVEGLEERVAFLESVLAQSNTRFDDGTLPHQADIHMSPPPATTQLGTEDDIVNDLASKVGMLGVKAAGAEPHYLGSSSVFAFSRVINSSLRHFASTKPGFADLSEDFASSPSPCLLPDYATAIKLSNAYFQSIHPQYPFLHEPTFRRWEADLLRPTNEALALSFDFVPIFFVNMVRSYRMRFSILNILLTGVLGVCRRCHAATKFWGLSTSKLAFNFRIFSAQNALLSSIQQLYMSAQLYIDHIMALDNLESIQAVLCCAMYSLRSRTGPSIWYFLAIHGYWVCSDFVPGNYRDSLFACVLSSDTIGTPSGLVRLLIFSAWSSVDAAFGAPMSSIVHSPPSLGGH